LKEIIQIYYYLINEKYKIIDNYLIDFIFSRVSCPILVLHAEDDHIIPIKLGKKLVESATSAGKKVTFIEFEGDREFLHKFIHRAQELPDVIRWDYETELRE
jgi:fermentation-respiration switch protein FrsA (DUF1100 family)